MKKFVMALLFLFIISTPLYTQIDQEKSVLGGVLLGGISMTGFFIPGTYGWGNFYAGDYLGFALLNVLGSCNTLYILHTWGELSKAEKSDRENSTHTAYLVFYKLYMPIYCSALCCMLSTVLGGTSVAYYNDNHPVSSFSGAETAFIALGTTAVSGLLTLLYMDSLKNNHRSAYILLPRADGLDFRLAYRF